MHESSGTSAVRTAALTITGFLEVAHALIEAGRPLDLSGFEAEVGRLCAQALDLPPDEGRTLLPALSALFAEIDGTGTALARRDS